MIHEACMPVYIVIQIFLAHVHSTRGSTRGPRGPKNGGDIRISVIGWLFDILLALLPSHSHKLQVTILITINIIQHLIFSKVILGAALFDSNI